MKNNRTYKKIAIITGAAGGIGSAIADKLIEDVDILILMDINRDKLSQLMKKLNSSAATQIIGTLCDISDSKSVNKELEKIVSEIGLPNILINNAGIGGPFHRLDEVSDEEWYQIINTNLKGVFNLSRYLLPHMKQQGYGRVINIASVQGYLGAALSSTYVASKHGVIGYTRAIAAEWGAYGITCNAVCPGYVDTIMGIQEEAISGHKQSVISKTPLARLAQPSEIGSLVKRLIHDELFFINGSVITIDGGLTCHVGIT